MKWALVFSFATRWLTRENLKNCIAWIYITELASVNFGLGKLCKLGAGGHISTTSCAPTA